MRQCERGRPAAVHCPGVRPCKRGEPAAVPYPGVRSRKRGRPAHALLACANLARTLRIRRPFRSSSCALFSSSLRCASREKERAPKFLSVKGQSQRVRVVDEHRAHRAQLFLFLFTKIQLKESYPKGTRRSRIRGQFDLKKIFEVAKREVIF